MNHRSPDLSPDGPEGAGARRAASITLSQGQGAADPAALMDPANQSLAEALRITFRLVQLAMIVLGALYLLSGFQSVKENEQGIRLLFGARESDRLEPGFRFSYPAPMGELVKVGTGQEELDLDDFWVYIDPKAKDTPLDQLPKSQQLSPEREGSVLTADGNVAHTKWKVTYSRDPMRIADYAEHVLPGPDEIGIVRAAVKRAVVQAVAQVTIDDLLKQAAGEAGSVASRAKELAQGVLDRLKSGIRIDKLLLTEKMPPLFVREKFNEVQSSESNASKQRDLARSEMQTTLHQTAGGAAPALATLISRFEGAVAKDDAKAKDAYLAAIYAVLEGKEVTVDELSFGPALVGGEVTSLLSDARQYRSDNVNRARADVSQFQAKLNQFRTSPLVLVNREWADAMRAFLDRDFVQVMTVPAGTRTLELQINSDPAIIKELEKAAKIAEGEKARLEREKKQKESQFRLDTGLKVTPQ